MRDLPDQLGGGLYLPDGDSAAVVLDRRLTRTERRSVLAHELIHDERHGGVWDECMPESWRPVVARDEGQVDREVARRLVPLEELTAYCDRLADDGQGIEPWMVADEFDVTDQVARLALQLLTEHERGT